MNLDDSDVLADLALLAMYAEDMHRDVQAAHEILTPQIDERLSSDWELVAYLTAHDSIVPPPGVHLPLGMKSDPVYYGYLVRSRTERSQWIAAIRGTSGVEWIIDGQFLWVDHPRAAGVKVEHGFWDIYNTMAIIGLDGAVFDENAARGISSFVGDGSLAVVGHSLGSALATYLTFDIAAIIKDRVQGCFFASPRTGDDKWVALFHQTVASYRVINYVLDVVPYLPTRPAYATLPNLLLLEPGNVQSAINVSVGCNHHVICYCAMLSRSKALAATLDPKLDGPLWGCVIGDASLISDEARSMAAAVKHVGTTLLHVSALFRGMFNLNIGRHGN